MSGCFHWCFQHQPCGLWDWHGADPHLPLALQGLCWVSPAPPSTLRHPISGTLGHHRAILALQQQPKQQRYQNKSIPYALNRPIFFEGGTPGKPKPFGPQPQGCKGRQWHLGVPRGYSHPTAPLAAPRGLNTP